LAGIYGISENVLRDVLKAKIDMPDVDVSSVLKKGRILLKRKTMKKAMICHI
jgi:hypothetical protein